MKTLSYINGGDQEIEIGAELYFGQLWDGNGDGQELLESGAITAYEKKEPEQTEEAVACEEYEEPELEEYIVAFEIVEEDKDDILDTLIKVTDIY